MSATVCSNCGSALERAAGACARCGHVVQTAAPAQAEEEYASVDLELKKLADEGRASPRSPVQRLERLPHRLGDEP